MSKILVSGVGHENKSYTLTGDPALTFVDVAKLLSEVSGKEVPSLPISDQECIERKIAEGLPPSVAEFALGWVQDMNNREWDQLSDLKMLIGDEPATVIDYLRDEYLAVTSSIEEAAK